MPTGQCVVVAGSVEHAGMVAEVFLVVESARRRPDSPLVVMADCDVHGKPAADRFMNSAAGHAESTRRAGLVCLAGKVAVVGQ
jgi:hypothetical protein